MIWIRTATRSDLPRVREILVDAWHATYDSIYGEDKVNEICADWHSLRSIEENFDRQHSEFLVADEGANVVGMAFATQDGKTIKLHQLYVHPDFHGKKAGFHLLIEIENSFMDCDTISLEVEENNSRAVDFYKAYGFEISGRTENCGRDGSGIPALTMSKPIIYADE